MKIIMKSTVNYIVGEANKGVVEFISRIQELNSEVIQEQEKFFLLRTEPITDESYSI